MSPSTNLITASSAISTNKKITPKTKTAEESNQTTGYSWHDYEKNECDLNEYE